MTKRSFQRLFEVLGVVAMLGAVMTMPLTATDAFAMSSTAAASAKMAMSGQAGEMPCHKTSKHCPDCPQKVCPEMGSCLVKCFQSVPAPLTATAFHRDVMGNRVPPAPALVTAGSLIPPLLRPPSF